jgi:CheY-like chemotaxis protein/DNA-binding XRE family transcriptional regulator
MLSKMNVSAVRSIFASSVRRWRNHRGLTQEELAELADLHRTYISDVERGARNLSLESIDKLARALGISLPILFASDDSAGATVSRSSTPPAAHYVEIVLVESNPGDANATLETLSQGHLTNSVRVATDGAEALDFLFGRGSFADNTRDPNNQVVLLELDLPKVSGVEVLRQLKNDKRTCNLPVVILSASDQHRDLSECKRLGAAAVITKPVSFQGLSQAIPALNLSWALVKSTDRTIVNHSTARV